MRGIDFAKRALEVAGDDPGVLANAAYALAYFGEDIGTMMAFVDRALTLNPSYARGWHQRRPQSICGTAGHHDRACTSRIAPEPARPSRSVARFDWLRAFL